jgi:seryl-tRNA synthetase
LSGAPLYMRLLSVGLMLRSVALASRVGSHAAITRGLSAVRMQVATASSSPTLDERLIADEPELIKKTLRMRRADESMLQAVDRIGELTKLRAAAVAEGNDAREVRKKLSPKIGALVKNGETAEAEKLKAEVAQSATEADAADAKLEVFDAERTSLFNKLPNLLDERVVDGADDNANIEVFRWRCDDLRTGKLWHDEFGTQLGGIDMDGAAKLSGARFSVLKGGVARLERALINFFLDFHTGQHG